MRRGILAALLLLAFVGQGWGATVYVSNSTANGYAVGNDNNTYTQAQHLSGGLPDTPWATVSKAATASVNGDTIIVNDGVYAENTGASGYLQPSKAVTINALNDYAVVIRGTSGTSRVIYLSSTIASPGVTLGKVVIDAQRTKDRCLYTNASNGFTINGARFLDPNMYYIHTANPAEGSVFTINEFQTSNSGLMSSGSGFYFYAIANSTTININGPGDISFANNASGSFGAIYVGGVTAGVSTLTVAPNVTAHVSSTSGDPSLLGVFVSGFTTVDIAPSLISFSGTSGAVIGAEVPNHATIACVSPKLHGMTITTDNVSGPMGSVGIQLGDSITPATANNISGGVIYSNTVSYFNKGIVTGWVTGATVYQNVSGNNWWSLLGYKTISSLFYNNVLGPATSAATAEVVLDEGGANNQYINNTINAGSASAGAAAFGTRSLFLSPFTHTTGIAIKNNVVTVGNNRTYLSVGSGDNATSITNNLYYGTSAPSNAYSYANTSYDTLSAWKATGWDAGSASADPLFTSSTDYRPLPTSPLIGAGVNVGLATDYAGNLTRNPPSIGAYEDTSPLSTADPADGNVMLFGFGGTR